MFATLVSAMTIYLKLLWLPPVAVWIVVTSVFGFDIPFAFHKGWRGVTSQGQFGRRKQKWVVASFYKKNKKKKKLKKKNPHLLYFLTSCWCILFNQHLTFLLLLKKKEKNKTNKPFDIYPLSFCFYFFNLLCFSLYLSSCYFFQRFTFLAKSCIKTYFFFLVGVGWVNFEP